MTTKTIVILSIILFNFMFFFVVLWLWYFNNEMNIAKRFYTIGSKALNKKDYSAAIGAFLKAIEAKFNFKEAFFKLGVSYLKIKEYGKAKENFNKATKIKPKDFKSLYNFAISLEKQNEFEEAKEFYIKALSVNPKDVNCLFKLGFLCFREGFYERALEYFNDAKKIDPQKSEIAFYIVKCFDEMCKYETDEDGQAVIEEYLKLEGKDGLPKDFEITLAKAYAKTGQIENSMARCRKALETNEKDVEAHKLMGLLQLLKKDLAAAKGSLSTAVNLDMNNIEAHDILSYLLCQNDDRRVVKKCRLKYQEIIKNLIKVK